MQTRNKTYARSLIPFSAKCLSAAFLVFVLMAIDISAQTFTFSNSTTITINSSGAASPAPSTIVVGMSGQVVNATVTLNGMSHARPDDIGIVLVSPTNKKIRLMTDNGGSTLVTLADVTFDDRVSASLSDNAGISSGTYKPSLGASGSSGDGNTHGADIASAPASPYSLLLSDLDGDDAMGTWSLYVDDDTSPTTGSISGGWTLNLTLGYAYTNPSPITIPGTGTGPAAAAPYASNILVSGISAGVTNVRVRLNNLGHTWPDDV
ncbi:MAG: hypothetical protein ABI539_11965, partial [Acidobacteriota bacterium]